MDRNLNLLNSRYPEFVERTIKEHGPIPPGWGMELTLHETAMRFLPPVGLTGAIGGKVISAHPLSSTRQPHHLLLQEAAQQNTKVNGVSYPPVPYWCAHWTWDAKEEDAVAALTIALNDSGVDVTYTAVGGMFKELKNKLSSNPTSMQSFKDAGGATIYHPLDRTRFFVLQNEPIIAEIARNFQRSTVIYTPQVTKDQVKKILELSSQKRASVRSRWSTGLQEQFAPIHLGAVHRPDPKSNTTYWYAMKPTDFERMKLALSKIYTQPAWDAAMIKAYAFPSNDMRVFQYALVAAHRTKIFGTNIQDEDLGGWVAQYGQHLNNCNRTMSSGNANPKAQVFRYDKSKPYPGQKLLHYRLTGWVASSPQGSYVRELADRWEQAATQMIAYRATIGPTRPSDARLNTMKHGTMGIGKV